MSKMVFNKHNIYFPKTCAKIFSPKKHPPFEAFFVLFICICYKESEIIEKHK